MGLRDNALAAAAAEDLAEEERRQEYRREMRQGARRLLRQLLGEDTEQATWDIQGGSSNQALITVDGLSILYTHSSDPLVRSTLSLRWTDTDYPITDLAQLGRLIRDLEAQ